MVRSFNPLYLLLCLILCCGVFAGPARAEMQDYPIVKLQSLDKITARTMTFEARVGSTVKFGPLYIKVRSCRKAPPIERPESAAFLQIWEVSPDEKAKWIFSGWMFASSPSLSAMNHAVYDVWVLDCLDDQKATDAKPDDAAAADKAQDQGADQSSKAGDNKKDDQPAEKTPADDNPED